MMAALGCPAYRTLWKASTGLFAFLGVTQLAALPSLVAGRHPAGVPRQLRNAYFYKVIKLGKSSRESQGCGRDCWAGRGRDRCNW